jgi:hypothetical protein
MQRDICSVINFEKNRFVCAINWHQSQIPKEYMFKLSLCIPQQYKVSILSLFLFSF